MACGCDVAGAFCACECIFPKCYPNEDAGRRSQDLSGSPCDGNAPGEHAPNCMCLATLGCVVSSMVDMVANRPLANTWLFTFVAESDAGPRRRAARACLAPLGLGAGRCRSCARATRPGPAPTVSIRNAQLRPLCRATKSHFQHSGKARMKNVDKKHR